MVGWGPARKRLRADKTRNHHPARRRAEAPAEPQTTGGGGPEQQARPPPAKRWKTGGKPGARVLARGPARKGAPRRSRLAGGRAAPARARMKRPASRDQVDRHAVIQGIIAAPQSRMNTGPPWSLVSAGHQSSS